MSLTLLSLLCLVQVWPSSSQFVFEVEMVAVNVTGECDTDVQRAALRRCEPVLQIFCLREGRATQSDNVGDCPLGRNLASIVAYTPDDIRDDQNTRPGLPSGPVTRKIVSQKLWPGAFQLYIEARELDPSGPAPDVHLDDIFINRALEVNTNFTKTERYNGTGLLNSVMVIVDMRFRVMCEQNYYGADCVTFCLAQNDSVNGYYTCNSDGSIQCRDGFKNPSNNCTEAITACDSSPCANSGNCTSMEPFNFTCQCVVGYTGRTCEVNIDDCVSATCPNNSICEDGVNTYECICMPEFEEIDDLCVAVLQTESPNKCPNAVDIRIVIGVVTSLVLIIGILIIVIVVLSVVIIKGRKPHHKCTSTDDRDIETKPNEVYGLVSGQTNEHLDRTTNIEMKANEVYGIAP